MSQRPNPTSERHPGPAARARLRDALRPWVERGLDLPAPPPGLELSPRAPAGYVEMATRRALQLLGPQLVAAWRAARSCRPGLSPWEFGQSLAASGLTRLLREAPLLSDCLHRALAGARQGWCDLLASLQRDLPALVESGCLRPHLGRLCLRRVRGPLSDFHDQRTALKLDFGPSGSVIFKPRDSRVEDILQGLARRLLPSAWQWPAMLARPDASWVRWIGTDSTRGVASQRESLAEQLGGILCFAHLFRISDLHQSNLLVSGGTVVPVDLETAFHPAPVASGWRDVHSGAALDLRDSILHTGMLSLSSEDGERGAVANFAVLGPWKRQRFPVPMQRLREDAGAGPEIREVQGWTVNRFAGLWSGGAETQASSRAAILRGFRAVAQRAREQRAELLAQAGTLTGLPVRELSRNTCYYGLLIDQFLAAPFEETQAGIAEELARVPATGAIGAAQQTRELASICAAEAPRFRRAIGAGEIAAAFAPTRRLWTTAGLLQLEREISAWLHRPPRLVRAS